MLVGRLFHARATVTRNDRSPYEMIGRRTIRRGQIVATYILTRMSTRTSFRSDLYWQGQRHKLQDQGHELSCCA